MTPALVLYCSLACWRAEPPPVVQPYLELERELQRKFDDVRRRRLEICRRARATIEETIETTDEIIELIEQGIDSGLFSVEDARDLRRTNEGLRQLVELSKKQERELLERQPGGITAPAPRPVKR